MHLARFPKRQYICKALCDCASAPVRQAIHESEGELPGPSGEPRLPQRTTGNAPAAITSCYGKALLDDTSDFPVSSVIQEHEWFNSLTDMDFADMSWLSAVPGPLFSDPE